MAQRQRVAFRNGTRPLRRRNALMMRSEGVNKTIKRAANQGRIVITMEFELPPEAMVGATDAVDIVRAKYAVDGPSAEDIERMRTEINKLLGGELVKTFVVEITK